MVGIIVVFPNKDNATNIRNLLVRAGLNVTGVCTTGAQAMNYADSVAVSYTHLTLPTT